MGFLSGLAQYAGNAVNPALAVVAERQRVAAEARQQAMAQQIMQIQQQREQEKQDLLRQSTQSTIGMNAAHTSLYNKQANAAEKPDIRIAQDGTPYVVNPDQSLSPMTIRDGTSPATTQGSVPGQSSGPIKDPGGDIDLRNPSAASAPTPGPNQQATKPPQGVPVTPRPKFGARQPSQSTIPGTPEWLAAETAKARIGAQFRVPDQVLVQTVDPTGKVVYTPRAQAAGMAAPGKTGASGALAAPMASKVGQFGEMLKKSGDLLPAMEALDVSLSQSAGSDVAQHGVGVAGMHIPGTKGLGAMMVNRTPEFAKYQTVLTPFVLANAHALSGARINNEQAQMIRQSIEMQPSDAPPVRKQRIKNVIDQLNSIAGSIPADAVAEQESQMDPQVLDYLRAQGYKGHSGAPSGQKVPSGSAPSGFDPDAFYAAHKAKGKP